MVNQSRNKFTMKTKYGAAVAPVFVLAGAYVAWSYLGRRMRRKKDDTNNKQSNNKSVEEHRKDANVRNVGDANVKNNGKEASSSKGRAKGGRKTLAKSVSLGAIHGGKLALQRLLDFHAYHSNVSSLKTAEIEFETLLSKENPEFGLLQRAVVKMEMSGKEAKAVEMLKKALEKAMKEGKSHEAYEIEMLLAEMLIYMGNIEEASKCKCLEGDLITDARRPLYKTIIQYLGGDPEEQVLESFNKFREIQSNFQMPASSEEEDETHKILSTFEEFKTVMESLKQEAEEGSRNISATKS